MTLKSTGEEIPFEILTSIFNDTTNSYKFYWFLAILDILKAQDLDEIPIDNICEKMIESVWYPLNVFKLSFGKQDNFKNVAEIIQSSLSKNNSIDFPIKDFKIINFSHNVALKLELKKLTRWVPYRFIRPFFKNEIGGIQDQRVNSKIIELSNYYSKQNPNLTPYYFKGNNIILTKTWKEYLKQNIGLLRGYTFWKLVGFVQKNNPNVSGISEKLLKPEKRNLSLNIKSWDYYLKTKMGIPCLYSNEPVLENFSLDHFIPWTYTVHDLNWNIIPTSKNINSSKSDNLPSLDKYLSDFVDLQQDFYSTIYESSFEQRSKILEHYNILFNENELNIFSMPKHTFGTKISETIHPMVQIATNMGFNNNWTYQNKAKSKK